MKFRLQALQAQRQPDELDAPMILAEPRGWIAVFVVLIVLVASGLWTFAGSLPVVVSGTGLLTHPGGATQLQSAYGGTVIAVDITVGQQVAAGDRLVRVGDVGAQPHDVRSPVAGRIIAVETAVGRYLAVAAAVATIERTDLPRDRILAMVFVPATQAGGIRPGVSVTLAVSTAPPAAFGRLLGTVTSVSLYPLTDGAVADLVGGSLAAQRFLTKGPPRLVLVDLRPDPATASGYAWTTPKGWPAPLASQTAVEATVRLAARSPFNLFLGR